MDDPTRKAAVLLSTLDAEQAQSLLSRLPATEAVPLRRLMSRLSQVAEEEREAVIQEFLSTDGQGKSNEGNGVELDLSVDQSGFRTDGLPEGTDTEPTTTGAPGETQFAEQQFLGFLRDVDSEQLASCLAQEGPRTIAVVIAQLPPEKAADILRRLPDRTMHEVLPKLVQLDEVSPEALAAIEEGMRQLFRRPVEWNQGKGAGLAALQRILKSSDVLGRQKIVATLGAFDQRIAAQLELHNCNSPETDSSPARPETTKTGLQEAGRHDHTGDPLADNADAQGSEKAVELPIPPTPRIGFAELTRFRRRQLQRLAQASDADVMAMALMAADQRQAEAILKRCPPPVAKELHRRMFTLGPIRLTELRVAANRLLCTAEQFV